MSIYNRPRRIILALLVAAIAASAASGATPIAWYRLDETSGTSAADSSGNGNTGVYAGNPTLGTTAVRRFGVYFGGDGKYLQAPAAATLNSLGVGNADFSVAFWVKPNALTGGWRPLLHKGGVDAERGPGIWLQPGNNRVHFRVSTTAGWNEGGDSATALPDGVWSHLAFVKAGDKWRCYINGLLDSEVTLAGATTGDAGPLYLGDDPWYGGSQSSLDDVRLFDGALTLPEIQALVGVVGHWKFDEASGTVAADSTNTGNAGTHVGSPAVGQSGIVDAAVIFDGVNDYTSVPESASLVASDSVAFSAWIRPTASANSDRMILNKEGEYEVALTTAGEIKWAIANTSPGWAWHLTGVFVPDEKWSHLVVTYDGAEAKTYLNGLLVETYAASGTIGDAHPTLNELRIGGRSNSPSGKYFSGKIDDVHVFTRAVSATEAANLHGLVGHWRFAEGAGAAADSTAFANNAALSGSASWTNNGLGDVALYCNGAGGIAATTTAFSPPSVGTVAFWMRASGPLSAQTRLFGLGGDWEARQAVDGTISFDLGASPFVGNEPFKTDVVDENNRWYHIAVTFDANDESYKVFVDGELQASGTSPVNLIPQSPAILSFGTRTGSSEYWKGALRDFRVYNRKLSQAEVYELYGLVGWYKLNETSGSVAADSTGLGRDGVYVGMPTLGATSNGYAPLGTAVDFNGANYVQVSGLYDKSSSASLLAWVRLDASDANGADLVSLGDHFVLRLQNGVPGVLTNCYNGSSWTTVSASPMMQGTGWHHVAAVLYRSGLLSLYVDGVEVGSAAAGPISYAALGANTRIAAHANGSIDYDLDGAVDDVRIFNRAMLPEDVYRIYRGSRTNGVRITAWSETR